MTQSNFPLVDTTKARQQHQTTTNINGEEMTKMWYDARVEEWRDGPWRRWAIIQDNKLSGHTYIYFSRCHAAPAQTRVTSVSKPRNIMSTAKPRALKLKKLDKSCCAHKRHETNKILTLNRISGYEVRKLILIYFTFPRLLS